MRGVRVGGGGGVSGSEAPRRGGSHKRVFAAKCANRDFGERERERRAPPPSQPASEARGTHFFVFGVEGGVEEKDVLELLLLLLLLLSAAPASAVESRWTQA